MKNTKLFLTSLTVLLTSQTLICPLILSAEENMTLEMQRSNDYNEFEHDIINELSEFGKIRLNSNFKQYIHTKYFPKMDGYTFEQVINAINNKSRLRVARNNFLNWLRSSYYCGWAIAGSMYSSLNCGQGGQFSLCTRH